MSSPRIAICTALETARWALGVQWHPEVDPGSGVVEALVEEAAVVAPA